MTRSEVQRVLLEDEHLPKQLRLNDGSRVRLQGPNRWLASIPSLTILRRDGYPRTIPYHNISMIVTLKPNGGRRRGRRAGR
jgi:hypothetical protein